MGAQSGEQRRRLSGVAILASGLLLGLTVGALTLRSPFGISWTTLSDLASRSGLFSSTNGESNPVLGQRAPDFTLNTLDDTQITLSDLRGQAVLINFWATWCGPCRLEMPELVHAYEAHQAEGFVILALNLTAQDSLPDVKAFAEEFELPFPVLLDETGEVATDLYQLRGLPTSVFIDRKGRIVRVYVGAMAGKQIEQFIREILP